MKTIFKNDPTESYNVIEQFESENLSECLDYYKETKDILPLENAIDVMDEKVKKAINDIIHLTLGCRASGFTHTANALCEIRENLQR